MSITTESKKVVKYMDINGNEFEAHNTLVVYRKMKSKRCKCHHCRINESGFCTYGRCRHERTHHAAVRRLTQF